MTDLLQREDEIRDYFSRPGTVSAWWHPEKSAAKHFFVHELRIFDLLVRDILSEQPALTEESVLDVGTGRGRFAIRLGQLGFGHITGIDLSEEMLSLARENASQQGLEVRFQRDSAESLETVADGSVSLICLMQTFDHIPNTGAALQAVFRKLKPNGILIGTFINQESLYGILFNVYRRLFGSSAMIAQVFAPSEFIRVLQHNGLSLQNLVGVELLNLPHDRIAILRWVLLPFYLIGRIENALFPNGYRAPLLARHSIEVIFLAQRSG
jgi:2-polyprenyl-3-methyl-5-hydroxy-6-metoxy-1,4-benzoquinol methylase